MKIDLFDTSEFIRLNKLQEVTDPVTFVKGAIPSTNGLLSTDIFGVSVNDRKNTFAYIDLHGYFLHPFIYKLLKRLDRNFESIVNSTKKFKIENGKLIEDENGETGLGFLYKNWENIDFEKNNSLIRNDRIDVLKIYKKNVLFTRYWLVIPAFYRDMNLSDAGKGVVSHHEVNQLYSKLIRLSKSLMNKNSFDFVLNTTRASVQLTLVDIYNFFKQKVEKKDGMLRKNLLGKSTDYGARSVISAPVFHADTYDDMKIDFYHVGIPLSQCCSLFNPFIVNWVKNFFQREFEMIGRKYPYKNKDGSITYVELDNPELYFNDEFIKKNIDRFLKSPADRFDPIEIPLKDKSLGKVYFSFVARVYEKNKPESESNIFNRPTTWTDILYQAAVDVTSDKCVFITRYPLTDYFGIFPNMITVTSTRETMPVYINNRLYKHYPKIDTKLQKNQVYMQFIDTVSMSNLYLKGLGGD